MQKYLFILLYLIVQMNIGSANAAEDTTPLVIGAVYNLHGFQSDLDIPSSRGAQLAVTEINKSGGLLGRPVKLAIIDGESKPKVITAKIRALLNRYPELPGLIGLSDTDMVLAAAPVAAESGVLFLTSGATSPKLPLQVPGYLFLACFGDNVQAAAAAETAWNDLAVRRVAVLYAADNTYTALLQRYFRNRFTGLGGKITSIHSFTSDELKDVSKGLLGNDMIFLATGSAEQAFSIIKQLRSKGITAPIFGGDSYDSEKVWQQHVLTGDIYFTTHAYLGKDNPNPAIQAFRKVYSDTYDGIFPDAFAALGYDAANLLMKAIESAGSTNPELVRQSLSRIHNFNGITGNMRYVDSRIPLKSVSVLRIKQGNVSLYKNLVPQVVPNPDEN